MIREYFSEGWRSFEISHYRVIRVNVLDIAREKVVCPEISNSEFKRDMSMFAVSLRIFPVPPSPPSCFLSWYRNRSFNLKTVFHAFKLHPGQSGIGHIFLLPFIPSFSPHLISSPALHPPSLPGYFRAVPPFVFIRAIGKGVRSRAFYLFLCFTAWCFRTNVSLVEFGFI